VGEAVDLFRAARRIWRGTGYAIGVALATCNLGRAEARLGASDQAVALLEEAEGAFRAIGVPEFAALAHAWRAEALLQGGRVDEALETARRVLAAARAGVDDHAVLAVAHRTAGLAHLVRGDLDRAGASLVRAVAESEGNPYEAAITHLAQAALEEAQGASGAASRARALGILTPLGAAGALALPVAGGLPS
jgi:tetratricopeptide (TPR) repeat protein